MGFNDSNKLNRANYKLDLMKWYDNSIRIINETRYSHLSLNEIVVNKNLKYYDVFFEDKFKAGNIDKNELDEIIRYMDSIEEYYEYSVDRSREYSQLLTEINGFIKNGEVASNQASQIMAKFEELKAKKEYPPEFSYNLFNLLPKLSSEARELLTDSASKALKAHGSMLMLETTAHNINYTIKSVKEHGEYQGFDHVEVLKQYGKYIQEHREYINSQREELKSKDLSEYEIVRINDGIKNSEEAIVDYLDWAEKAEPVLNKHGITVLKNNIPISGLLDISTDVFDRLSISMAGINVLDSSTVNDIGMNVFPSAEIMVPIQVN
ncbi:hypothetical protein [Providencia alcalifaciens]|uniref:hypothetical protein n=1 Tax=Providencia alcalifaciens TaxID=126385 RepID=UPI001CC64AD5|nr:hypothetical protein [Providencia alcalifaciens]CAG9413410.1 hypothetical protein NVI2019_GHJFPKLH_01006 [Providencia alcalifaciens]